MIRTGLIWSAILIAAMVAMIFYIQAGIGNAETVPVHWGVDGQADRFATPAEAVQSLWLLIVISVGLSGLFALWPKLDPKRGNLEKSRKPYLVTWIGTLALMTVVMALYGWSMRQTVSGDGTEQVWLGFTRVVLVIVAVMVIILGNYLPKTRQNWILGVRTPWTLSDADNWERTHRVAGKASVLAGLIALLIALFMPIMVAFYGVISLVIAASFVPVIYSFVIWRSRPEVKNT